MLYRLLKKIDEATLRTGRPAPTGATLMYGPGAVVTADLEHRFFASIRLANGTFKTTSARRLDDLNDEIFRHLPRDRPLAIKDVAVSSGISTVEWYEALREAQIKCNITATDLLIHARLVRKRGGLTVLLDGEGSLLQIDVAGVAFRPEQIGRRERAFYALPIAVARRTARRAHRGPVRAEVAIDLVSPRLSGCPDIDVREEDLFAPSEGQRWDVIRAANVLNRVYFKELALRELVARLAGDLRNGGLLAICRTDPELGNQASVFQRGAERFELLGEIGGGSEVRELVLTARLDQHDG
jgi:hypothetical protein